MHKVIVGLCVAMAAALGSRISHAQIPVYTYSGDSSLGTDLDYCGDLNGDGKSDFVIGISRDSTVGTFAGRMRVHSGANGTVLFEIFGEAKNHQFGNHVATAGDVDNDGVPDVMGSSIVTATTALSGYVRVYSGKTHALLRDIQPPAGAVGFGSAIKGGGDVDGDGYDDVLVGAFSSGEVYVFSGKTGGLLEKVASGVAGDHFGASVDFIGDVNGDLRDDFVVGAPYGSAAYVYSGKTFVQLKKFVGEYAGDRFGTSVADAGDYDHDGQREIVVGAPLAAVNGSSAGYADVLRIASGQVLAHVEGLAGWEFGTEVDGAGDMNKDGTPDFLVGSPYADFAALYSGKDGQTLSSYIGDGLAYGYGGVLAGGGDVDGDGTPNVIIGSSGHPMLSTMWLQVKVFKEVKDAFTFYGESCSSFNNVVPRLDLTGNPKPGGWVGVRVSGANKPSPVLVFLGSTPMQQNLATGCPVLIGDLFSGMLQLQLTPQTLGSGEISLFLPIPGSVTAGGSAYLQAVILEDGNKSITTNAVRMKIP